MTDQIETLGDALPKQIARNRKLLENYRAIGPVGQFGLMAISADIARAERAMIEGDTVAMLRMYRILKENK